MTEGELIKAVRASAKASKKSMAAIAAEAGVGLDAVKHWLRGATHPPVGKALAIAQAAGLVIAVEAKSLPATEDAEAAGSK